MAAKVKYLLNRSGRYWARVMVPAAVRNSIGKRELLQPLGPDRREALRALPGAVATMLAQVNAARAMAAPRTNAARGRPLSPWQLAQAHYGAELAHDNAERSTNAETLGYQPAEHAALFREGYRTALTRVAAGRASHEETAATIGWAIDAFAERGNATVATGSAEWRAIARTLAGVQLEVLARAAERDTGNYNGQPKHPALVLKPVPDAADPLAARRLSAQSDLPLSELVAEYSKERDTTPAVNRETDVAIRMFEEHLGEPRPVYRITRADMLAFKRALGETPVNYVRRFPDMKLPEAITANKQRKNPYECLSARTIGNKYLSRLHSLLAWCASNDIIPDNPAAGVKVSVVQDRAQPPRINFSAGDLAQIFSAERYQTGKPFNEEQWAELISLFGGMRASELGQMRLDSIRTERDVLCFFVEEQLKNLASRRIVPVHPTLIRLGIEDRVKALRGKRETHLFPVWHRKASEAKANAENGNGQALLNHYYPRFIPRAFNRALPKIGISDTRLSWHSFRHSFKSGLASAGVERSIQDQLCGHADNTAGARYIHTSSIEALKAAIERLQFDGFNL